MAPGGLAVPAILIAAAGPADAAAPDWREFDRRARGWAETPTYYDAAGVAPRDGGRVRVTIRYEGRLSGLPDPLITDRVEIDCPRRALRRLERNVRQGSWRWRTGRRTAFVAIETGSMEEALAARLCPRAAG